MGEQVDRISSLADPILCHILSFLPIKDTVGTSILSSRWRNLFASSIPILDFNSCLSRMSEPTENDNNFLNFVDTFFSNPKQLSLECLKLNDDWVRKNGIPQAENYVLHCVSFHNISELNIRSLSLKRLVLDFVELYVDSHRGFNFIGINAPNLVYFKYVDGMAEGYTLSEMKSLERADIEITLMDNEDHERATNLLQGICNVQSLYLAIEDGSKTLFSTPLDPVFSFNNLVKLKFRNYYNDDWQGAWIVEFLRCTPNLNALILDLASTSEGFRPLPKTVPSCLLFHIKEIEIKYFEGEGHMFEMESNKCKIVTP
ncbi:hypothetical protein like AT3G58950 [Hibiscus trionum]|uniref:F-box domain-containing protein n=1 Tax=Hibiscus trionum TaxID=183268 RepID=A0A9W7HXN5_HIBTR|nr:hypothetical protein like AT3G58950 [Hibiscus trionum]